MGQHQRVIAFVDGGIAPSPDLPAGTGDGGAGGVVCRYEGGLSVDAAARGGLGGTTTLFRFLRFEEGPTTNQRMELLAAITALEGVGRMAEGGQLEKSLNVFVVSDSAYVVNCFEKRWWHKWMTGGWRNSTGKPVANVDLWRRLLALTPAVGAAIRGRTLGMATGVSTEDRLVVASSISRSYGGVYFVKVKGHSGIEGNEAADALATEGKVARHLGGRVALRVPARGRPSEDVQTLVESDWRGVTIHCV